MSGVQKFMDFARGFNDRLVYEKGLEIGFTDIS
jgi:hypothetical protein